MSNLPHIRSLDPAARREVYAAAVERATEAAQASAREVRARKSDPRSPQEYRAWKSMGLICALVVKHQTKPASIEISRDGGPLRAYLPDSKTIVQPESTEDFVLACVPKWLGKKLGLLGVTLPLCEDRVWSDDQRETWDRLGRLRFTINSRIHAPPRPSMVLSRSEVA